VAVVVVDAQIVQPHLPKAIVGEKAEEVALKAEGCDKAVRPACVRSLNSSADINHSVHL